MQKTSQRLAPQGSVVSSTQWLETYLSIHLGTLCNEMHLVSYHIWTVFPFSSILEGRLSANVISDLSAIQWLTAWPPQHGHRSQPRGGVVGVEERFFFSHSMLGLSLFVCLCFFFSAVITNEHKVADWKQHKFLFQSSGAQKSKIMVLAWLVSSGVREKPRRFLALVVAGNPRDCLGCSCITTTSTFTLRWCSFHACSHNTFSKIHQILNIGPTHLHPCDYFLN